MNWLTDLLKVSSKPKPKKLDKGDHNMSVISTDSEDGQKKESKVKGKFTQKIENEKKQSKGKNQGRY